MKRIFCALPISALAACSVKVPPAPPMDNRAAQTETGTVTRAERGVGKFVATVADVNIERSLITVKGSEGELIEFDVSPKAAARLTKIEDGDRISVEYFAAMAYEFRSPTAAEIARPEVDVVPTAEEGEPVLPGTPIDKILRRVGLVTGMDPVQRTVTVQPAREKELTYWVEAPDTLEGIQVGDTVTVVYSRPLVVSLEPNE